MRDCEDVPVYRLTGVKTGETVTLPGRIFDVPLRVDVAHRVVLWQRNKRRRGLHATKTRAQVKGTTKKARPQKGGGRARVGDLRAPQMRGGGGRARAGRALARDRAAAQGAPAGPQSRALGEGRRGTGGGAGQRARGRGGGEDQVAGRRAGRAAGRGRARRGRAAALGASGGDHAGRNHARRVGRARGGTRGAPTWCRRWSRAPSARRRTFRTCT